MVMPPADRHRAAFRVLTAAPIGAVLVALTSSTPAWGQKPGDIIKRMQALYKSANAYRGSIKQNQSGKTPQGQAFTFSQTQVVTFRKPNQIHIELTITGTGAAAKVNGAAQTIVSDGKTVYQYDPKKHLYIKQTPPGQMLPLVAAAQVALIEYDLAHAKVVSSLKVGNRNAMVIEAVPDISKAPAAQRAELLKRVKPVDLTIDSVSYALLRIGPPADPSAIELSAQVFNGPVSSKEFMFVPPPNAKLFTPPPGAKGGAPGGVSPGSPGGAH